MIITLRGLKERSEIDNLFSFYSKVLKKTPIPYFSKRIYNSLYATEDIRVAEEDSNIVGSITVFRRFMYWNNKILPYAGIGNVATLPEKQGLGIATEVMKDALDYLFKLSLNISILFTGINSFYKKFSFIAINTFQATFYIQDINIKDYSIRNFNMDNLESVSIIYE